MFRSAYSKRQIFYSPSGLDSYCEYVRDKDEKGVDILKKGCEHIISEELRAAARGADIQSIFARARAGDPNAIGELTDDMFGDLANAPRNLLEAHNLLFKGRKIFDGLSLELRQKFNNNPMQFMNAIADGSFFKSYIKKASVPNSKNTIDTLSPDDVKALKSLIGGNTSA